MLSVQTIREQTEAVRQACLDRQTDGHIDEILERDAAYRALLTAVGAAPHQPQRASKAGGRGKDTN